MIRRSAQAEIANLLHDFAAVGILGPRQVGKTTLALEIAKSYRPNPVYLDLESPSDRAKLSDPESYFEFHKGKLIILDEVQRTPELFSILRGVIDRRRREGLRTGQFLIVGSASLDLLQQSSETLAGRIIYKELSTLNATEVKINEQERLWVRGGFPDSFLGKNDELSMQWRLSFIATYLERDVPQFGPRIPATTLRRLWTMLAHSQGEQLNIAKLGASLDVSAPTAKRYIELLEDLLLIRTLRPWSANIGKRLVKSPKVYIRDSGLTHALLHLSSVDELVGHPVIGSSWEGFVVENLISVLPAGVSTWFYRTAAGAEIDLVIEFNSKKKCAIEIKRSTSPRLTKGFYLGCEDINATDRFVVYPGKESYPMGDKIIVMPLVDMMKWLAK